MMVVMFFGRAGAQNAAPSGFPFQVLSRRSSSFRAFQSNTSREMRGGENNHSKEIHSIRRKRLFVTSEYFESLSFPAL